MLLTEALPATETAIDQKVEIIVEHYRRPPEDPGSELTPIELSDPEAAQLVAFLRTLSASPPDAARSP